MKFVNITNGTITVEFDHLECRTLAETLAAAQRTDIHPDIAENLSAAFTAAALAGQLQADYGIGQAHTVASMAAKDGEPVQRAD